MVAAALAGHHAIQLSDDPVTGLEYVASVAFVWMCFVCLIPYLHRDVKAPEEGTASAERLRRLLLTVVIPVKNEDPAEFAHMLASIAAQTRRPQRVHIVENGTFEPTLSRDVGRWAESVADLGIDVAYDHTVRTGKRFAQGIAIRADPHSDVIATIDSDVRLHPECFARGLAPFVRRRVMSVAGVMVGDNTKKNLLTRLLELSYVCSFLNGRAAYSMLNSVNVNCGGLAFYRGWVVRAYLEHYLSHKVAGRRMEYGDDAMMTRYAAQEGETLLQTGAIGWTLHPEKLNHLTRQRIRWWRSFFWGSIWLFRAFSPKHPLWWITSVNMARSALYLLALAFTGVYAFYGNLPWQFAAWVVALSWVQTLRYLPYEIPGVSGWQRLFTWSLAPLAGLLNLYLGPCLQLIGGFTCLKTGWGTRDQVEVRALEHPTGEILMLAKR